MKYINKKLTIEKVNFQKIANKFGTPFYSYSYSKLKENVTNFKNSFKTFSPLICFAIKSNTNINLIREIRKLGLGADVVSIGELMLALKAGINPKKIVFSGVGKTSTEISFAIEKKILLINAESLSEIKEINRIAKSKNRKIKIGVRLNPNTDAKTLNQISTGKKENKFGVNKNTFYQIVNYCKNSKNVDLKCLSVHIGSHILDNKPYEKMLRAVSKILSQIGSKTITTKNSMESAHLVFLIAKQNSGFSDSIRKFVAYNEIDYKEIDKICLAAAREISAMVNQGESSNFLLNRWGENGIAKQINLLSSITQIDIDTCTTLIEKYQSIAGLFRTSLAELSNELSRENLEKLANFY